MCQSLGTPPHQGHGPVPQGTLSPVREVHEEPQSTTVEWEQRRGPGRPPGSVRPEQPLGNLQASARERAGLGDLSLRAMYAEAP